MLAIIQARMSSNRLPGKVMMPLGGKLILDRVISRVTLSRDVNRIIVATSNTDEDGVIHEHCLVNRIECFRGSLKNVAQRFASLMMETGVNAVIRISGDSPFIDPNLISIGISHFKNGNYDLVTNVFPRTFPKGQSVEIIRVNTFLNAFDKKFFSSHEQEHVTSHFYFNEKDYSIYNFINENINKDYSGMQLSIDDLKDFQDAEKIIFKLGGVIPDWLSIVHCRELL